MKARFSAKDNSAAIAIAAALECTRIVLEGAIHDHLSRLGRRLTGLHAQDRRMWE